MWTYTIEVTGTMCGMCESHINATIGRAFFCKKLNCSVWS